MIEDGWLVLRVRLGFVRHYRMVCGSTLRSVHDTWPGVGALELRRTWRRCWLRMCDWNWNVGSGCGALLRGLVRALHFHGRRDGLENMLRRNDISRMRRLANVSAMVESYIVVVARDDLLIWRDNQVGAYGYVKRADPDWGRAI